MPPDAVLLVDAELLHDEQLRVRSALGRVDFDNQSFHGSSWWHRRDLNSQPLGPRPSDSAKLVYDAMVAQKGLEPLRPWI